MLPMAAPELRARIAKVLEAYRLPTGWSGDPSDLFAAAAHDKKANAKGVSVVTLPAVGSFALEEWSVEKLQQVMKEYFA